MGNTGRTHFKKGHIPLHKGRRKYSFICLNCEKINGAFTDNRKYCNQHCYKEYKIKYPEKFNSIGFKNKHIPWNKGENLSQIHKINLSKSHVGKNTGQNHPNWKGGKTKLMMMVRVMRLYQEWRSEVFKRDNYSCQNCGDRNNKGNGNSIEIHAHHIIPFSKIFYMFEIKTFEDARKCKLLFDVNNGITYCKDCHIKKDKNYGVHCGIKN